MVSTPNGPLKSATEELGEASAEYSAALTEVEKLERLQKAMSAGELTPELLEECPELSAKLTEIEKTKYRIEILKKSIATQTAANAKNPKQKTAPTKKYGGPSEKKPKAEAKPAKVKRNYVHVEDYGDSIFGTLKVVFTEAISKAFPEEKDLPVILAEAKDPKFGNYQLNSAMAISKVTCFP
uniref:Arg_tRNA_synt_N domain-containing protein n=1 Tax=Steinernema glaseri TaxID=37863 RepID=A0A1I7Y1Q2_9BILA